jgi:hypothetical protein
MGLAIELLSDLDAGSPTLTAEQSEKLLYAYRQGVHNTLVSVGLAFGLEPTGAIQQGPANNVPRLTGMAWTEGET